MENKHDSVNEKQSLKDKLAAIILLETSKDYKEMDGELVAECVDFLMELEGKEKLTQEEIEQRVKEIPFKGKVTAIDSYVRKKIRAKRLVIVAAILAVIVALFGIIAVASGDGFDELIMNLDDSFHEWFDTNPKEYGNITIYKADQTEIYSSIEEFAENTDVEILYPTWLPENEKIISIWCVVEGEVEEYLLQCDVPNHSIGIKLNYELTEALKINCTEKEISGLFVYYEKCPDGVQGNFIYKNNCYIVKSDTEDNLFRIIENLKEIN